MKFSPVLLLPVLMAGSIPQTAQAGPIMQKGRDVSALLRNDSLARVDADRKNRQDKELRDALIEAMRVNEYGADCIAFDPATDACLLTVEEYNRSLENRDVPIRDAGPDFPSLSDVERERGAALKSLLDGKFLSDYPLSEEARDSLARVFRKAKEERLSAFHKRQGDSALHLLYNRHYASMFQGKEEKTYQVLVSSDSILTDSLRRSGPSKWGRVPFEALTPELARAASEMAVGDSAGPILTPFGFAYLRFASRRKPADIPFEEALPELILLQYPPMKDAARRDDLVAAYYRAHREEFPSPDTARFRIWLLPEALGRTRSGRMKNIREDTARVRSRIVSQTQLPLPLQAEVARRRVRVGRLLGPVRSLFGTWYFQTVDLRKGGRPRALADCRPEIEQALFGSPKWDPEALAASGSKTKESDLWKDIVDAYLSKRDTEIPGTSETAAQGAADAPLSKGKSAQDRLEREKIEWIRKQLVFNFIDPSEIQSGGSKAESNRMQMPGLNGERGSPFP
jgi:hypothetical protein